MPSRNEEPVATRSKTQGEEDIFADEETQGEDMGSGSEVMEFLRRNESNHDTTNAPFADVKNQLGCVSA